MKTSNILKNPYILFSPFLIFFILWVIIYPTNGGSGDEGRYLGYAENLIRGFYSPPAPDIALTNGPGYPILLTPFVLFGLPLVCITLLNAFLYYFSIIFLFKALNEIVSPGLARSFSFAWAFYYIAYQSIPFIHTETFTYFLISVLILLLLKAFKKDNSGRAFRYVIFSGFILGFIVLTKMIFGYVLLTMLVASGLLWIFNRKNLDYQRTIVIILVAFATTLPYLIYTYHLTGRTFFWGTGSDNLYWMTSPNKNEFGSWFPDKTWDSESEFFTYYIPGCKDSLILHHGKELDVVHKLRGLEQDDAYKNLAVRNIKEHPLKYIQNIIYNTSRLIFQYPFSYGIHRSKIMIIFPLNGILLTLLLFSLIPTIINWRKIIYPLRFLLFTVLIYLGSSVLITTYVRMFAIIVPVLIVWIAFILQNTLKISLRFNEKI